ncbi:hypothetical protein ANN_15273 [Periplaneta americana]|uniref:Uncharacterized protein n=1 Tax=Periplaneta americana TaxID=6978 RepID=A0ABQ8SFW9_PERAM|nr:hypothetical protein ANN_15273 [Periplaneta americana]
MDRKAKKLKFNGNLWRILGLISPNTISLSPIPSTLNALVVDTASLNNQLKENNSEEEGGLERPEENLTEPEEGQNERRSTPLPEVSCSRRVVRNVPIAWPPRSPDLTPLDFFLWGYIKDKVYATPIRDLRDLRERIIEAIESIPEDMVQRAWQEIVHCLDIVTVTAGAHEDLYPAIMSPYHHGMARLQVADRVDGLQIWRMLRQPIRGGPPAWGFDEGLTTQHRKKQHVTNPYNKTFGEVET